MVHIDTGPGNPMATKEQRKNAGKKKSNKLESPNEAGFIPKENTINKENIATTPSETIRLGQQQEVIKLGQNQTQSKPQTILDQTKDIPILGKALQVMASPKTTVVLGSILAGAYAASYLSTTMATTAGSKVAINGGSLIGRHVNTQVIGEQLGLSKEAIRALSIQVGKARVNEVVKLITSPKNAGLMKTVLTKTFSPKTMAILGGAAGTVFLGKWAQKETGEPISIVMRDILKTAQTTGDYTMYNEAAAARNELTDMKKWEQILSWTPYISPFITIPKAIKGVIQGGAILDELAKQSQIQTANGESDDDKWARIETERIAQKEQERLDDEAYYTRIEEERTKAKAEERKDDEKYWNKIAKQREADDKAKREAEAKYWNDVRKMEAEIKNQENAAYKDYTYEDNTPSKLSFGLL